MIGRLKSKKGKIWNHFKVGTAYLGIRNLFQRRIITQTIALKIIQKVLKNLKHPLIYLKWFD